MKGESILFRQLIGMHAGLLPQCLRPPMAKPLTSMHLFTALKVIMGSMKLRRRPQLEQIGSEDEIECKMNVLTRAA